MPSRTRKPKAHAILYPFLALTLILWFLYRSLFQFPVWFDETVGKALFFALPVWLYISLSGDKSITKSMDFSKVKPGLLLGVAIGGLYGFAASLIGVLGQAKQVQAVLLFTATGFWWEFFLSLMTGFWESLFFFSFAMTAVMAKHKRRSLLDQVFITAFIFIIFHIQNAFLRFSPGQAVLQIPLLFLFAMGQAFVFAKWRNFYTLVLSHAIWGMVLLIHV